MPAEFMMLPIRMNSGAASSGKELADCAIFCGTMPSGKPPNQAKATAASPIETKSGTPISSEANQTGRICSIKVVIAAASPVPEPGIAAR